MQDQTVRPMVIVVQDVPRRNLKEASQHLGQNRPVNKKNYMYTITLHVAA